MIAKTEFSDLVANAYQSLYDFVRLRSHPLAQALLGSETVEQKERGWQVHHILLETIEELYPGPAAPPFSKEWRRHRLMVLRYVEGLDPQAVADQLAISRRQYYREHGAAVEAIADILWERCDLCTLEMTGVPVAADQTAPDEADVMQRELVRISQHDTYANLPEVIEGVLAVLNRVLAQNDISTTVALPDELPVVSVGHNLLRQVILGVLGLLAETAAGAHIDIAAQVSDTVVRVLFVAHGAPQVLDDAATDTRLAQLRDMLQLGNADIHPVVPDATSAGFAVELPLEYTWTVLAVDDNEDTLALYKRCLIPNGYRVITTTSADAVLKIARNVQPDVLILDLMMPEHDGWDLLQQLSNQPDTARIPIMICSVLKQKELALSLGAAAYLPKPFTDQSLLHALDDLLEQARQ